MTVTTKLTLLAAATISLALPLAQAHAETLAAPAPVHSPENISQINGQLVEVGSHNKYDRSYNRINISADPISAIFGIYGVQGSYALNSMIALRADAQIFAPLESDATTGSQFTASAAIYFKQMYQGIFLEPGLMVRNIKTQYNGRSTSVAGPQVLLGYQFMWDTGLNVSAALGGGRNLAKSDRVDEWGDSTESPVFGNGYLRFGYSF